MNDASGARRAPDDAPMRILLVSEDVPARALGGLAKHMVTLGNALLARGHEVVLLGNAEPDYASCAAEMGFHGRFIGALPEQAGWWEVKLGCFWPAKRPYYAKRFAEVIAAHATAFDVVHYHGHLPMIGRYLPESMRFVQTRHDQGSECMTHVRFRAGARCESVDPRVCANCIHPAPGPLRTAITARAVQRYRAEVEDAFRRHTVIYVSDFLRRNYRRAVPQAHEGKVRVVHNFVDEARLQAAAPGPRDEGVVVHLAGRIDQPKGMLALLDLLAPRLPEGWLVRVMGTGPLDADVHARHGTHPRVRLIGHVAQEQIYASLKTASVAIVPSICEESFSTAALEALRLGVPCYALRRGGNPELARYGAEGQLRLFDDLPALVEALLAAPAFPRLLGGESVDVQRIVPRLLEVYHNA